MSVRTDVVNLRVIVNGNAAKQELAKLDQEYIKLKNDIRTLKKGTDEYIKAHEKLRDVEMRMGEIRKQAGLSTMTLRELNKEAAKLKLMKQHLTPGTDAFRENEKQLRAVQQRIQEVSTGLGPFATAWKEVGIEAKAAMAFLGIGFAVTQIGNLISGAEKFDEAIADVSKSTGLGKEEMTALNSELSKIDTRTGRAELLDLAYEAGKLGNQSKDDVMSFVRAADQIKVSLGRDLGNDAITSIGKMVDIFKLKDDFGLEQGMLKIASVINDIGMSSTATESYLVDFAKRMSGVANVANITAPEIIGLAGTLDSLGQTSEVSSTAISKLLTRMGSDIGTFAKMAKMNVGDFRAMMNESGLKALLKVIEEMGKSGGGLETLAAQMGDIGMDGGRVVGVLGTLSANMDEVRRQTDIAIKSFDQGSSITAEFNIKNQTLGATLAKTRRELMGMVLTEGVKNSINSLILGFSDMVNWLKENGKNIAFVAKNIGMLIAVYGVYKGTVLVLNGILKLHGLYQAFVAQNTLRSVAASKISTMASKADIIATTALSAVKALLAGNLRKAAAEYKLLSLAMSSSPIGIAISLVTAAAMAYSIWKNRIEEVQKSKEEAAATEDQWAKRQAEEIGTAKALFETLKKTNPETDKRKRLIDEINARYGTTLQNLKDEKEFMDQVARAQEVVINNIKRKMAMEAQEEALKTNAQNNIKYQLALLQIQDAIAAKEAELRKTQNGVAVYATNDSRRLAMEAEIESLKANAKAYEKMVKISDASFSKIYDNTQKIIDQLGEEYVPTPDPEKANKLAEARKRSAEEQKKQYDDIARFIQERQELLFAELLTGEDKLVYETAKAYREKFLLVQDAGQKERLQLLMTKDIEDRINQYRKDKAKEYAEERKKAEEEITEGLMTEREKQIDKIVRYYDNLIELNKKFNITTVDLEAEKQKAIAKLKSSWAKKEEKELEEWQNNLKKMVQSIEEVWNHIASATSSILSAINNRETAEFNSFAKLQDAKLKKLDENLKAGLITEEYYAREKERIEQDLANSEKALKAEQWRRQRDADLIMASIKTALAVVTALASSPPPANYILAAATGVAGAAQIAAIATQPEPKFGQGAIFDGPSHQSSHKGMPVVNPLTGKTQAYFEGGEGLIPKKAVEKNRALVEALIDAGRKDGHLAPVNFRNLTRSMDALSMAKSGYWKNDTAAKPLSAGKSPTHKDNTESLHELVAIQKQLLAAVKEEKTRPAIISHRQWEKNAEEKNKIRRLAGA
jgi:TP901 family phage tail tape measure protein